MSGVRQGVWLISMIVGTLAGWRAAAQVPTTTVQNTVYYADVGGTLKAFAITNAKLSSTVASQTGTSFGYPGTSPSVSANGTANAIVWVAENASPAVLHAYDATNLTRELYNSNQAANGRDNVAAGNKFIAVSVADGKVFLGTVNSVGVFGLLH